MSHKCSYAMALISVEMRLRLIFGLMLRLSEYQSELNLNLDYHDPRACIRP